MKSKPVQYFNSDYLQRCKSLTPDQIIEFEENFRNLMAAHFKEKSVPHLTIDTLLLEAFKTKAQEKNIPYQALIEKLMRDWMSSP